MVQMLETKNALENLDVTVILARDRDDIVQADVVHVFNCQTIEDSLQWIYMAREIGKPIVLSTIFWDLAHYFYVSNLFKIGIDYTTHNFEFLKPLFDRLARLSAFLTGKPAYYGKVYAERVRLAVELVDVLLPNSIEEEYIFTHFFGTGVGKTDVVLNATRQDLFKLSTVHRDIDILSVGRLEPTKNQLGLARACSSMGISLKLIGNEGENKNYLKALYRVVADASNISVVSRNLPKEEIAALMSRARVHALPSFRESPGLVTLEALASGCSTVVSDVAFCPVNTYFKDFIDRTVYVCNPYDVNSISYAVSGALVNAHDARPVLAADVSWESISQKTLSVYKRIINQ